MPQEDEYSNEHIIHFFFMKVVEAYYNCFGNFDDNWYKAIDTLSRRAKTQFGWSVETMRDGDDLVLRIWDPSTASTIVSTTLNIYVGDGEEEEE